MDQHASGGHRVLSSRTLSIHTIDTTRRELFYWAAVVATFAMGTAVGDLPAVTFKLGYDYSIVLFAAMIMIPAIGFRWLRWNAVFAFWFAYVVTRPLGASVAEGIGKPKFVGGLGVGDGPVALTLTFAILVRPSAPASGGSQDYCRSHVHRC
jgi:uncharacterized membrane-anchored protein